MSDEEPSQELPDDEPVVDPAAPVRAADPYPFSGRQVQIDAPMEVKRRFFAPTVGAGVTAPGAAETVGGAPRAAIAGQHNWVPIGPRNVGGRVRAIAVHPNTPAVMYAAPASGGIFKSLDGAESWFPLWHDEPSLSMAAISICPAPAPVGVVWAATGETEAGGGETIPAAGVLRSADGGATWTQPDPGQAIRATRIHAVAAHPTNPDVCWAATTDGLYRSTDKGKRWTRFGGNRSFSDIQFVTFGANLRLFIVPHGVLNITPPATGTPRAMVVRIDAPDAPDAALAGLLPDSPAPPVPPAATPPPVLPPATPVPPFPPPPPPPHPVGTDPIRGVASALPRPPGNPRNPTDGKLAIYPGGAAGFADPVVFVVFGNVDRRLYGVFRSTNAHTATPTTMTFRRFPVPAPFADENQGEYNLTLAVSPRNPNHLAFGMVELFMNRDAAAAAPQAAHWRRAQMWDLYHLERGHHADHHHLVFAPVPAGFENGATAGDLALWDANDGGVSWCANWPTAVGFTMGTGATLDQAQLPLPDGSFVWRKRSHGISCTQMYDLTQHPRLPTVMGCGFQDNGVYLGYGGPSWQLVLTADGGFVAFDPDDPYRVIATWQGGITESRFPGRLRDAFPLLRDGVITGLWPRDLTDGFGDADGALFVAETAAHPTLPGRLLTARANRLYGTRRSTGDRWNPEPLGTGFEIIHEPTAPRADSSTLEVLDTPGARALGLLPTRNVARRAESAHIQSRARSLTSQPYAIAGALDLQLVFVDDAPPRLPVSITVPLTVGPRLPASATAAEVADYLTGAIGDALRALPPLAPPSTLPRVLPYIQAPANDAGFLIASTDAGTIRQIVITEPAPAVLSRPRAYHGADAGAGHGAASAALPAVAPILARNQTIAFDLRGRTMRITREGGASRVDIDFTRDLPLLPVPVNAAQATMADVVALFQRMLPAAAYRILPTPTFRDVRLTSTVNPPVPVTISGSVSGLANADPGVTAPTILFSQRPNFDLTPVGGVDERLRIAEGGHQTANQAMTLAFVGVPAAADMDRVTSVEMVDVIRRMLAAAPTVQVRCDLDVHSAEGVDIGVTELTFGPRGSGIVWAGDAAGRLYRSRDDGERWSLVAGPFAALGAPVDAIAVRPDKPDVVLAGTYLQGSHPTFLHLLQRSDDGGAHWAPVATPIVDAAGGRVGIRALEFDPAHPEHVYAATDVGVHRSVDSGSTWAPFNEGLPNVRVTDLTFEPTTRTLRAAAWGRGVYERHLGDRPPKDVVLHVRSTVFDDGFSQPTPGPDPLASRPEAVRFDTSPDIKVTRVDPRRGVLLDGVEFDDELRTVEAREGVAFVAVQVHNRGAFPTSTAKVAALWAPADDGPPPVPPELWAALSGPAIAPGTAFGRWKVIGDQAVAGAPALGHEVVAPGYPRVVVFGAAPAFSWTNADLTGHRRVGILAVARSSEDAIVARGSAAGVMDLVRTQAKVGYREIAVVTPAADETVVLRASGPSRFRIVAGPGATNGANGAAPFGLSTTAAATDEARFTLPGPYALPAPRSFVVRVQGAVTVTLGPDEPAIVNRTRVFADEVAAAINRLMVDADLPVRARTTDELGGVRNCLVIDALGAARMTVGGTAAALLGVAGTNVTQVFTPNGPLLGPWPLADTPPRTLVITVTVEVPVRLAAGAAGLPASPVPALDVRDAINRQLLLGGVGSVVAEPVRRGLSVRRSATEATSGRDTLGGLGLADLVAPGAAVVDPVAQRALFDVIATHGLDRLTAGAPNELYLRSANTGNVAEPAVRHRLELLDLTANPITHVALGAAVTVPVAAGTSTIVHVVAPVPAAASGDRRFVVVIADVDADGRRVALPDDATTLDAFFDLASRLPNVAVREFVVT